MHQIGSERLYVGEITDNEPKILEFEDFDKQIVQIQ